MGRVPVQPEGVPVKRTYLQVFPGDSPPIAGDVPDALSSLQKLTQREARTLTDRLNPIQRWRRSPLRFEFVALSQGAGQPVEFYYGVDDRLDALEQRLRRIYPPSFDIARVDVDLTARLLRPVEYSPQEFVERLEEGRLYADLQGVRQVDAGASATAQEDPTESHSNRSPAGEPIEPAELDESSAGHGDGGNSSGGEGSTPSRPGKEDHQESAQKQEADESEGEPPQSESVPNDGSDPPTEGNPEAELARLELGGPIDVDDEESTTSLEEPSLTSNETVLARPPLAEVEPQGVEWWGAAARRKDWMTTLTGFTDLVRPEWPTDAGDDGQTRAPLVPVVEHLAAARQPLAYQVVFHRRPDWTRDARRRTGELLGGKDTLLQKVLGAESGGQRGPSATQAAGGAGLRSPGRGVYRTGPTGVHSNPEPGVDGPTRVQLIRANTPSRTCTVNVRLLGIPIDEAEREALAPRLEALQSVFDFVDGPYYEIEGRRLNARGLLPGSGHRHARRTLRRFRSRAVVTGRPSIGFTNRREVRPDLVLNGNELAPFVVVPLAKEVAVESLEDAPVERTESHESAGERASSAARTTSAGENRDVVTDVLDPTGLSSLASDSVLHRDTEIERLTSVLEPLEDGEPTGPALITGPPGSGKTSAAIFAVDRFRQDTSGIEAVYVNCWEADSPFQVLYRILAVVGTTVDIHRQSTPRDVLLDRLRGYDGGRCVVILDEVDQLEEVGLLYDLLGVPRFSLVLITNREEALLSGVDDRLASRLRGGERIHFRTYTTDELVDILDEWASRELERVAVADGTFDLLAEAAGGDARIATTVLRMAARQVQGEADSQLDRDAIERCLPEARRDLVQETVANLPDHQRTLYRVIEERGPIAPKDLSREYQDRVERPRSDRTIRNYLSELERRNLVLAEGRTRDRRYRCVGMGRGSGGG